MAAQLALVMGAAEIHLYGCSFGTLPGDSHYAYDNRQEPGGIDANQVRRMDYVLSEIGSWGVRIYSHGWTTLKYPGAWRADA